MIKIAEYCLKDVIGIVPLDIMQCSEWLPCFSMVRRYDDIKGLTRTVWLIENRSSGNPRSVTPALLADLWPS